MWGVGGGVDGGGMRCGCGDVGVDVGSGDVVWMLGVSVVLGVDVGVELLVWGGVMWLDVGVDGVVWM